MLRLSKARFKMIKDSSLLDVLKYIATSHTFKLVSTCSFYSIRLALLNI